MGRVHAGANAAKMVQLHSHGNRPRMHLKREAMCLLIVIGPDVAVAVGGQPGRPDPTWTQMRRVVRDRTVLVDLGPEALLYWQPSITRCTASKWIAMLEPALIMGRAPAARQPI